MQPRPNAANEYASKPAGFDGAAYTGATAYVGGLPAGLGASGKPQIGAAANPYARQAAQQYKSTNVTTANPVTLVLMMYDGAVRFIRQGAAAIEAREYESANTNIVRAQDIIAELSGALDMNQGEIAENLSRMYDYMQTRLVEANVRKETAPLEEVERLLQELREAWEQISRGEGAVKAGDSI